MDDTNWGSRFVFDSRTPPDYVEYKKQLVRDEAWVKILHEVALKPECKGKYLVLYLNEETWPINLDETVYQVEVRVSLAHERRLEILKLEDMSTREIYRSAITELKYRIDAKWYKFWNTERVKPG